MEVITIILAAAFNIHNKCHVTNNVQSKCTENLMLWPEKPKTTKTAAENRIDNSLEIAHTASMRWNYFQLKSDACANQLVNVVSKRKATVFFRCTARFNVQCAVSGVFFCSYNLGICRFLVRLPHEKREWANAKKKEIHNPKSQIASNRSECIYNL